MHTYWSKKPHDAIRQYIRHYIKPSDLVLDPFCGFGGTALAALSLKDAKPLPLTVALRQPSSQRILYAGGRR